MGAPPSPKPNLRTQYLNSQPVVVEVPEAVGLPLQDLHFGVEPFGDPVVAREPPHAGDLLRPGVERFSELNQLRQAGLAQLGDGAEESRREFLALAARAVFFQQQVAEPLLEAVDELERRLRSILAP